MIINMRGDFVVVRSNCRCLTCRHAIAGIKRQVGWDDALKMQPSFKTSIESTEDPWKTVGNPIAVLKIWTIWEWTVAHWQFEALKPQKRIQHLCFCHVERVQQFSFAFCFTTCCICTCSVFANQFHHADCWMVWLAFKFLNFCWKKSFWLWIKAKSTSRVQLPGKQAIRVATFLLAQNAWEVNFVKGTTEWSKQVAHLMRIMAMTDPIWDLFNVRNITAIICCSIQRVDSISSSPPELLFMCCDSQEWMHAKLSLWLLEALRKGFFSIQNKLCTKEKWDKESNTVSLGSSGSIAESAHQVFISFSLFLMPFQLGSEDFKFAQNASLVFLQGPIFVSFVCHDTACCQTNFCSHLVGLLLFLTLSLVRWLGWLPSWQQHLLSMPPGWPSVGFCVSIWITMCSLPSVGLSVCVWIVWPLGH